MYVQATWYLEASVVECHHVKFLWPIEHGLAISCKTKLMFSYAVFCLTIIARETLKGPALSILVTLI